MEELLAFFVILLSGLLFSSLFRRIHLPWVVSLIIAGIIVGPYGFSIIEINPTIEFIGEIGLIFLMFMAGLETRLSGFKEFRANVISLSFVNAIIPALVGFGIASYFGYEVSTALLIGIIFISSSIAIVIPTLEANNLFHSPLGKSIVSATVVNDVLSLVLFLFLLQAVEPAARIPLPLFYAALVSAIFLLRWFLPRVQKFFAKTVTDSEALFQKDLRVVFIILIGTVAAFDLLQLHPILAGFFAGFVLSDSITSDVLKSKLRAISYGIFIPTFFVIIGAKTNIGVLFESARTYALVATIVLGSIFSKLTSGWAGGRLVGFTSSQSWLIGMSTIPQLSTTLAAVSVGIETGLLDAQLSTAIIVLSIVTTIVGPLGVNILSRIYKKDLETFMHHDVQIHRIQ